MRQKGKKVTRGQTEKKGVLSQNPEKTVTTLVTRGQTKRRGVPGLRICIHLIWIQHFRLNTDPD
jgi:hypothetical protein